MPRIPGRSLAEWDLIVEARATKTRAHPSRWPRTIQHDRAFDLLIAAVQGRDRCHERMQRLMAGNSRKQAFRAKEAANVRTDFRVRKAKR